MENVFCPYCSEEIKKGAKICKHCQKDLTNNYAKNNINKQLIDKYKKQLLSKLKDKIEMYPVKYRNKIKNDLKFLRKLEIMTEEEIKNDIFKRERKKILHILWGLFFIFLFFLPFVFLFYLIIFIWIYPSKNDKNISLNRIKNFKKHYIRLIISIIILLSGISIFSSFITGLKDVSKENKIENTKLSVKLDGKYEFTDKEKVKLFIDFNNINKLFINDKEIKNYGDNKVIQDVPLKLGKNKIIVIGKNEYTIKKVEKDIERLSSKDYNLRLNKIKEEKKKEIELKLQEKKEKDLKIINNNLEALKKFKLNENISNIDQLNLELIKLKAFVVLINNYKNNNDKEIQDLLSQYKNKLTYIQINTFPKLRKIYAKLLADKMWDYNIKIYTKGNYNSVLELVGGYFASNKNKKEIFNMLYPKLEELRFDRINFKWYKYDDDYTYWNINSLQDKDIK